MTKKDAMRAAVEALSTAEAALSDIGDADREPGDDVAWCEARAAQAIPATRAALSLLRSALEEGEDGDYYSEEAADIAESKARKEASAWWALVMGAAASIEDAANCLRDADAKKQADGAAKHYRDAAQRLMAASSPTTDKDAK